MTDDKFASVDENPYPHDMKTYKKPVRKTRYLGCMAFNESPEALGGPPGFIWFSNESAMWTAFAKSEGMNMAFDGTGLDTYSSIFIGTDDDGYVLFHLMVISVKYIRDREAAFIAAAKDWLRGEGVNWMLNAEQIAANARQLEIDLAEIEQEQAERLKTSMSYDEAWAVTKRRREAEKAEDRAINERLRKAREAREANASGSAASDA